VTLGPTCQVIEHLGHLEARILQRKFLENSVPRAPKDLLIMHLIALSVIRLTILGSESLFMFHAVLLLYARNVGISRLSHGKIPQTLSASFNAGMTPPKII
jgi:hypothetical protein